MTEPTQPKKTIFPPRLSMDEYVDFIEASIRTTDPILAARQKDLEEQITERFRLPEDWPEVSRQPPPPSR